MTDETNKDNLESEKQGTGGETGVKQTTEKEVAEQAASERKFLDQKVRAEKAEAEAKELRAKLTELAQGTPPAQKEEKQKLTEQPQTPTTEQIEELLLRDKGIDEEVIAEIKAVAKGKGIGLLAAKDDPLIKARLDQIEAEKKRAAAKLSASQGSGKTPSKEFPKTQEEHEAMWRKEMGL